MQTQKRSLLEVCCNVGTGLFGAYLTWQYIIIPWAAILSINFTEMKVSYVFAMNAVFTIVSVVRGYFWRRIFNLTDNGVPNG